MRSRRAARPLAVLVGAALGLVVALLAAPVTTFPGGTTPADCASADTGITAGLVLDFGVLAAEQGATAAVARQCVQVATGGNGFSVLAAAGHTVRVSNSGLVCAIDGFPSGSECGDRTSSGYRYWAYFSGGSSWTYSGIGPASRRLAEGSVDGWHFVVGAGNPTDPPPNGSPQSCAPPPPPTTSPTTAPPGPGPTTAPPPPAPGPTSTAPGAPSAGRAYAPPVAGAPSTTVANPAAGATTVAPAAGPGPAGSAATGAGAAPPGTDDAPSDSGAGAAPVPGTDTASRAIERAPTSAGDGPDARRGEVEVATRSAASSTGAPTAPILVVLVVIALGGFAAVRLRTRREDI